MTQVLREWGMKGIEGFHDKVGALVIIDVLSFSTAVDIAVSNGAWIYPFPLVDKEIAEKEAQKRNAILALPRKAAGNQYSLSPNSLKSVPNGSRILLPSPNGSHLSLACNNTPVFTGCLRNAEAVANAAVKAANGKDIALIPAGERWSDGSLRTAIEDYLGAGAICHFLRQNCTSEAQLALNAYRHSHDNIAPLIWDSISGKELIERNFPQDVEAAVEENISALAPFLKNGSYQNFEEETEAGKVNK